MSSSTDFSTLSAEVLKHLGGEKNITSVSHCATRLRFDIKDDAEVDAAALESYYHRDSY